MEEVLIVIGTALPPEECVIAVYDLEFITEEKIRSNYDGPEFVFDKFYIAKQI